MIESTFHTKLRPIHPFPARMAPSIVWSALPLVAAGDKPLRVLDPMAGSGTTVATARMLGHRAHGTDTDPLAVLIARAWSTDFSPDALRKSGEEVVNLAKRIARDLPQSRAYPARASAETQEFVRYWFDPTARRYLASLGQSIETVRTRGLRHLLWCAFSRLLIVKSYGASLAMDVAHSRPHKVYERAPLNVFKGFRRAVELVASRSPFTDARDRPAATVAVGDARRIRLPARSIDVVMTSPPYLNAIDYLRGHKFSLIWMGHDVEALREIRATNVGTEVAAEAPEDGSFIEKVAGRMGDIDQLKPRERGMIHGYLRDMDSVMREVSRVLVPGGRAVFVVGDSTLRGVYVRNSSALRLLGRNRGLEPAATRRRALPTDRRYLPPPGAKGTGRSLEGRMREEVILTFSKPVS